MPPALSLHQITKSFGTVQALRRVDFALTPGTVHALLGENGAGKSTLMHIAFGMIHADSGQIEVHGRPVDIRSPRDARQLGIGMVHQHFASVASMTVRENVELATGRLGMGAGDWGLGGVGLALDPKALVEDLSVAMRQRLEIVKALATGAKILLLDEPTAVLAPPEIDELLPALRRFADGGGSVVLITHKLREVFAVADEVTVLRHGEVTLGGPVEGRSSAELAEAMVGGSAGQRVSGSALRSGGDRGVAAEPVEHGRSRTTPVRGPGFEVRAGEVVGLAAVEGNGQRSILRAVAGLEPRADIAVDGPVAFVPEDRSTEGLIGKLSLTENIVLGQGPAALWVRGPLIDWAAAATRTTALLAVHDVRASAASAPADTLSGGNQQKLLLAGAFERKPAVLVAENPTRGLDIRAAAEVHRRLREAAAAGVAVLVWSSDLDEVLELADRVLVMHAGVVAAVPPEADRARVGQMMLGVQGGEERAGVGEMGVRGER